MGPLHNYCIDADSAYAILLSKPARGMKSRLFGNRWLPQTTALRRLDYQEFMGAKKHLVLGLLSHTGPAQGSTEFTIG
jgi:hypothetical protein